ncbi:MAG: hypothetical protein NC541_03275 [bacterium]|nr:hypothetical protein [bacterium]
MRIKGITFLLCVLLSWMPPLAEENELTVTQQVSDLETDVMPMAETLVWRYKIVMSKIYKRLYNTGSDEWLGEWEYVCDL